MSTQIKSKLSDNEIEFMKQMEQSILPNRKHVDTGTLKKVGALVGISVNVSCRTCATKGGGDMLNLYGQLKPLWVEYNKIPVQEEGIIFTKFEESILEEVKEPLKKKIRTKKIS